MDPLDDAIVNILKTRGYRKVSSIAADLGVRERTVYRHLHMMKKQGIIRDLVRTNPLLLGFQWWAKIGLKIKSGTLQSILSQVITNSSVYMVAESTGVFDLLIGIRCKSLHELHEFINCKLSLIQGIETIEVFLHVWPRKYGSLHWPLPGSEESKSECSKDQYMLTELERSILDIYIRDGFVSAAKISSELGVSATKIRRCNKQMLDNNVYKLEVMIVSEQSERETVATIGVTVDQESPIHVLENIIAMDLSAIIVASFCIGKYNLIITARFPDIRSMSDYVHDKLPAIQGFRSADVFPHIKLLKYHVSQY